MKNKGCFKGRCLIGIIASLLFLNGNVMHAQDNQNQALNAHQSSLGSIAQEPGMMIRISEIEIFPKYLAEYITILKEEAAASVNIEPGVVCIFPMSIKDDPGQIRIVEIYLNKQAYQSHLKTPHFQHYKNTTLPMVKALKLIDMDSLDPATMIRLFENLK